VLSELVTAEVERVPITALRVADSPHSTPKDLEHVCVLAGIGDALPPVLVHRASMTVVDGIHRLRAAELCGRTTLAVRWFDGSVEDARLLAVALNVTHGLPLTADERTAAAEHILTARPEWSDRAVASLAGLSPGRTAAIRRRLTGAAVPGTKRVGRDGRARPLDPGPGRERVAALLREQPWASLRQIAQQAGVSPGTVAGVRARMARGPGRRRPAEGPRAEERAPDAELLHNMLRRDPALRFSETGRSLLRLMEAGATLARHREGIAAGLPPHCKYSVARLAQEYAKSWQLLAEELL
jgi:ParB-like chromosome segregation protein Spo0J